MVFEVLKKAVGGEGGAGFGKLVAAGQELGAAGKFAEGVLEARPAIGLPLGPVEGKIGEVFDIHLEAGEGTYIVPGYKRERLRPAWVLW